MSFYYGQMLFDTREELDAYKKNQEMIIASRCAPVVVPDQVNHPSHYTSGPIECWDAMCSAFGSAEMMIYAKVAAFKYLWRAGKKGPAEVDFDKSQWYLAKRKLLENQLKELNNTNSTKGVNP